jgi:hypothetical protein
MSLLQSRNPSPPAPAPNLPIRNWDDSIGGILFQYILMGGLMAVAMFALVAL